MKSVRVRAGGSLDPPAHWRQLRDPKISQNRYRPGIEHAFGAVMSEKSSSSKPEEAFA